MSSNPDHDLLRIILPSIFQVPNLKISSEPQQNVFELSFPLTPTLPRHVHSCELGPLGSSIRAALRLTREKVYWLKPSIDRSLPSHVDTQVLLAKFPTSKPGLERVACILPLTNTEHMGTLRGRDDNIVARFESDLISETSATKDGKIVIAIAPQIKEVMGRAVDAARRILGISPSSEVNPEQHIFSDALTYCTWNSLHPPTPATQTSVMKTLKHFASLSPPVRPTTLLLDDAWQHKDGPTFRLLSFEALPFFLDGMKDLGEVVRVAKENFGVQRVGVWHTIQGYWCGVEPSAFGRKYKLLKVVKDGYPGPFEPEGFAYYILHPSSVAQFFMDYYRSVASHGIEFTKCDNLASLDNLQTANEVEFTFNENGSWTETIGAAVNVASLRPLFKQAVQAAAKSAFGGEGTGDEEGRVIWCMEMSPRVLMGNEIGLRPGPARCIARNSDDYYPNEPDSHRYHIFTNAVNALFTSHLNIIPDLDMFQSHSFIPPSTEQPEANAAPVHRNDAAQASYHAALRAFGAGPVTITDVPGASDPAVLSRLLGLPLLSSSSDRSVALQADHSPWVGSDVFDSDIISSGVGKALRLFSKSGKAGTGSGLIGYWNVRSGDGKVDDHVTQNDLWEIIGSSSADRTFVLRSYMREQFYTIRVAANDEANDIKLPIVPICLDHFQFDIFSVSQLEGGIAVLGLVDKFNPLSGIVRWEQTIDGCSIGLKCCGPLGIFLEDSVHQRLSITTVPPDGSPVDFVKVGFVTGQVKGLVVMIEIRQTLPSLTLNLSF